MTDSPSILIVRTQSWLQVTRLTMRLAAYGCRISIICSEDTNITQAPHIAEQFPFSLLHPVRALRRAIVASGAEFILPTDDLSVSLLHEVAEQTPALRGVIERSIGAREFFPLLRSRFQLLALAHQLGISVPETELISNKHQLQSWCAPKHPAFVLKKDGTWGGEGVQIVRTPEEAQRAFQKLQSRTPFSTRAAEWLRKGDRAAFTRLQCLSQPEITAQAHIHGTPANSMYACHKGRILGEVQARVAASKGKTGPSLVIQLIDDPRISRAGRLLADALQLSGFFGLDFILDGQTGEPFLIELNPRATKLGHLAVANQPDLAGSMWAQWSGQQVPPAAGSHLGRAIYFHPEAKQWTQNTASFQGCRSDALAGEAEMLATLAKTKPALRTQLREGLWSSLLRLKGSPQTEPTLQTFYYQNLSEASNGTAHEPIRLLPPIAVAS